MESMTTTRRGLLALAAGGLTLAACGSDDDKPAPARGLTRESEAATLNSTLAWEHAVVAAYRASLPMVRGDDRRSLAAIAAQEVAYAEQLTALVRRYGGEPARPRSLAEYRTGFPPLRDAADVMAFMADVEERSVRKCLEALPRVVGAELRRPLAEMAVGQGRHLAAVRDLGGEQPAPNAFVTGTQ
jgi:ferritin-like protein